MTAYRSFVDRVAKPTLKRVFFVSVRPGPILGAAYAGANEASFYAREAYEQLWRSLVATPTLLARAASHGERIACDRIPYLRGPVRIELGSNIRISGQIAIVGSSRGQPELKVGNGVFIAHGCSFNIARRIELGDFVSIGNGCYFADTEGHAHYNPQRPIWEVPASDDDISPIVVEDNVQISRSCMILKGVRIGARSVIGAGSVVRSDIPPDSVVMGNPARVVRRISPDVGIAAAREKADR